MNHEKEFPEKENIEEESPEKVYSKKKNPRFQEEKSEERIS